MLKNKPQEYIKEHLVYAEEIAKSFEPFTDGVRVLFLIKRSKEGGSNKGDKVRKLVSKSKDEIVDTIYALLVDKFEFYRDPELRIYMSANPRNVRKAIRNFKQNQLDAEYDADPQSFYFDVKNRWISSLMKPSARAGTYFIIDCDTKDEYAKAIEELKGLETYMCEYPTKNGTHIITRPYDPSKTQSVKEKIHKDGLLLLDF